MELAATLYCFKKCIQTHKEYNYNDINYVLIIYSYYP